jgi:hypothetical protein
MKTRKKISLIHALKTVREQVAVLHCCLDVLIEKAESEQQEEKETAREAA